MPRRGWPNSYSFDRHGDAPILRPASGLEMWRRSRTFDLDHYEYGDGDGRTIVRERREAVGSQARQ